MSEPSRRVLLEGLIRGELAADDAAQGLRSLGWDVDSPVARLSAADAARMLRGYLEGTRAAGSLAAWAELLEVREDVDVEPPVQEVLFALANPDINGPLTPDGAREWLGRLQPGSALQ